VLRQFVLQKRVFLRSGRKPGSSDRVDHERCILLFLLRVMIRRSGEIAKERIAALTPQVIECMMTGTQLAPLQRRERGCRDAGVGAARPPLVAEAKGATKRREREWAWRQPSPQVIECMMTEA
jgi:hypothetical protein